MLTTYLIGLLTFLTPLFFWTVTPNLFSTPKEFLLVATVLVLIGDLIYRLLKSKSLTVHHSPLTIPLIVFILTIIGSLAFNPEGRPEAMSSKGLILVLLPLLSLFTVVFEDRERLKRIITTALLASTSLLSLHSLLSLAFLSRSAFVPAFMQNAYFTLTGSYLTTLALIILGLTVSISLLKQTSSGVKNTAAGLVVLHTISIVAIASLMLPGGSLAPTLLPYGASWSIALDALKSVRSLLFGIGLSNYSLLYTSVKPLSLNTTQFWNALPTTAGSELLTLLPTAGILATLTFLFLITRGLIWTKGHQFGLPFIVASLAFLLIPVSLPLYLLFFLFLSVAAPRHTSELTLSVGSSRLMGGLLLALGLFVAVTAGRVYLSEMVLRQAQQALSSGDTQKSYDLHLQSIRLSPTISSYHLAFADINFRLASALSQKPELTEGDRSTVTSLVQQSILSIKRAIELKPNSASYWTSLAKVYQNLINVAEGSDRFALDYYGQAVALDRANPLLRLEYGSLLSQLGSASQVKTDQAALTNRAKSEFQTAIQLKSDYANAYFNLAKIYEAEGDYPNAVSAMQLVIKYLDAASPDYSQALAELETMKTKLPKPTPSPSAAPSTSTDLTEPSPLPSPIPGGPLELPQN